MSRVYIVQEQMRWDHQLATYVPRFDLSAASQYGKFTFLLSPTATPRNPESILRDLRQGLREFTERDYLLLVGNPCLIGWAAAIAANLTEGQLSFLQWDQREQSYVVVDSGHGVCMFDGDPV